MPLDVDRIAREARARLALRGETPTLSIAERDRLQELSLSKRMGLLGRGMTPQQRVAHQKLHFLTLDQGEMQVGKLFVPIHVRDLLHKVKLRNPRTRAKTISGKQYNPLSPDHSPFILISFNLRADDLKWLRSYVIYMNDIRKQGRWTLSRLLREAISRYREYSTAKVPILDWNARPLSSSVSYRSLHKQIPLSKIKALEKREKLSRRRARARVILERQRAIRGSETDGDGY